MTAETWELVAVLLLAAAIASGILALMGLHDRWRLVAIGTRLGALGALIVALVLSTVSHGQWSPFNLHQLAVSVAVASLVVGLVLSRLWDLLLSDPVLDAISLCVVLVAMLVIRPGGPLLQCAQRGILFGGQWAFFVLGAGSAIVAGTMAFALAMRTIPWTAALSWVPPADLLRHLFEAVFVTLLSLGAGLLLSVLWAWQTYGTISSGDVRQGWMASAWLVAAMSLVAGQLERGEIRWPSVFAGIAGVVVLFGLLSVLAIQGLGGV
ncbi:MAG: hypothetical protein ACP5JJ_03695 [Anaerolineae bacterium]